MSGSRKTGTESEEAARKYLVQQGMRTIEKNFHSRQGEIDLIMLDGASLVFVEVRFRRQDGYGSAAESVTRTKQMRIIKTAGHFLQTRREWNNHPCRFDVMAITGPGHDSIEWIKDAFQPTQ